MKAKSENILHALRSVVQEVNGAENMAAALQIIVSRTQAIMQVHVCSVYLHDPESGRYVFMATEGFNKKKEGQFSLAEDEGLIGLIAKREELLNLEEAQSHANFHFVPDIGEEDISSFLGVPIIHQRKVLGVLVVQQSVKRKFTESDEAFLVTLSAQLAGVIAHASVSGTIKSLGLGSDDSHISKKNVRFKGVSGSRGVAIGTVVLSSGEDDLDSVPSRKVESIGEELSLFHKSLYAARQDIALITKQLEDRLAPEELALFDVYLSMLDDNALAKEVIEKIEQGEWVQGAWAQVILSHVRTFESMEDSYLKERAIDVKDLGLRVLRHLREVDDKDVDYPDNTVLCANELTASMLAEVPLDKLVGLISAQGSSNSHVAILARSMGIPVIMGASSLPVQLLEKQNVIVDAFNGVIIVNADKGIRARYRAVLMDEESISKNLEAIRELPSETTDGHSISLCVNTGLYVDVLRSLDKGAQGVGLYRTEVPFLMSDRFPSEEEQRVIYRRQLEAFEGLPVTMRTLDIGGDKALSYFPIEEDNPFLGWRGIRVTLDHPEIFLVQIRAMLKASEGLDNLKIMLPMISNLDELDEALRLIKRSYKELLEEEFELKFPKIGVMIEVPAAVYQASKYAERVDFLSVGSNDLTQYLLAVDRNNSRVADLYHSYHPAVLQACYNVAKAAKKAGKEVSICGELAGDPAASVLLMAMGFDSLSMNVPCLLSIKGAIRGVSISDAKKVLKGVLKQDTEADVRKYLQKRFSKLGITHVFQKDFSLLAD